MTILAALLTMPFLWHGKTLEDGEPNRTGGTMPITITQYCER